MFVCMGKPRNEAPVKTHIYVFFKCKMFPDNTPNRHCLWDLDLVLDFPSSDAHHTSKQLRMISRCGPIQPQKPKNQGHQHGHNLSIYSML